MGDAISSVTWVNFANTAHVQRASHPQIKRSVMASRYILTKILNTVADALHTAISDMNVLRASAYPKTFPAHLP